MPSLIAPQMVFLATLFHLSLAFALPWEPSRHESIHDASSPLSRRSVPSLRILCVGDSITIGIGDGYPDNEGLHNGYRLDLYNLLANAGIDAEFLGTQVSGTDNPQPNMEGYGFQPIDVILGKLQSNGIVSQQPNSNLVLIHAGTNDNDLPQLSDDPSILFADAPTRLGNLIDFVLCQDPDAVVIVAMLVQNNYNQEQTNAFNQQVPIVVGQRYMQGFKVRVVDMSMIGGPELADALLHPNAGGYADMANRWYAAIMDVPDLWWTTNPSATDGSTCGNPPLPSQTTMEPAPTPQVTQVSTDAAGHTIVQGVNRIQMTLPLDIIAATTMTSNGQTITWIPGGNPRGTTFTNAAGQTVVQDPLGAQTILPLGIATPVLVTEHDGEVLTFFPSGQSSFPAQPTSTISPTSTSTFAPSSSTTSTSVTQTSSAITTPTFTSSTTTTSTTAVTSTSTTAPMITSTTTSSPTSSTAAPPSSVSTPSPTLAADTSSTSLLSATQTPNTHAGGIAVSASASVSSSPSSLSSSQSPSLISPSSSSSPPSSSSSTTTTSSSTSSITRMPLTIPCTIWLILLCIFG